MRPEAGFTLEPPLDEGCRCAVVYLCVLQCNEVPSSLYDSINQSVAQLRISPFR